MLHKQVFLLAHECTYPSFYSTYRMVVKNQAKPYAELKEEKERALRHMVQVAYTTTPYYHDLFRKLDLVPSDIRTWFLMTLLSYSSVLSKDIRQETLG